MTALTAAQRTPLAAFTLPSAPPSVRAVRQHVRTALIRHDLAGYCEDAEIIASELATNAVMHGDGPTFDVELVWLLGAAVEIVVTDSSPCLPDRPDEDQFTEHGRGLRLIEALSDHWGCTAHGAGKSVYAVLTRR